MRGVITCIYFIKKMCLIFGYILIFLLTSHQAAGQTGVNVVELHPRNLGLMQHGTCWPQSLRVVEGHEALLKIISHLDNQQACVLTTPAGQHFDVHSPPSNRYEVWSEGCGVRIRNVAASDEGRWRLNATGDGHSITGWTMLVVEKVITSYNAPEIDLLDGQTNTQVELTTLENSYCLVAQPFSASTLVPGHCTVTLNRTTRAVQGNWNVLLGLPGRVQELQIQRRVAVEAERLDTGYIRDSANNKLHLYCNILNTSKNISFCRFQKTSSAVGYNVVDGLSDGSHSYYGEGFLERQCGMTIEFPSAVDYGTWRCSMGSQQWVDSHIVQQAPMQALISVGPETYSSYRTDQADSSVFVQLGQQFTVSCLADEALSYCWFQHPNGSHFTPRPIQTDDQEFWYTGESLQVGDCGITFAHAAATDNGVWTCHMGPASQIGLETTTAVLVTVTGPLAANQRDIITSVGSTITLYCHTANGNKPLEYCRFLTPSGLGFRIDSTVTEENAILDRCFFTPGRHLDYGDCSLTVQDVQENDIGSWTCAALIDDETEEASDSITVFIESSRAPLSQASIMGMVVGASVLVLLLIGYAGYKTNWPMRLFRHQNNPSQNDVIFPMAQISNIGTVGDNNSENSSESSESAVVRSELDFRR